MLLRILNDGVRPVTARVKIPALVRGDELITYTGAIRECIQLCQEIEATENGLSAGVMWGNPFTDVPELRTNSFVVLDGDEAAALVEADRLHPDPGLPGQLADGEGAHPPRVRAVPRSGVKDRRAA